VVVVAAHLQVKMALVPLLVMVELEQHLQFLEVA
jgi:hypothetical protein